MTNAFSSVPISLLLALVDRLGAPDRFCKLLNNSLRLSRVVKKGGEREGWFCPTSGVKQGCPLSPGLFVLLMEVAINKIKMVSRETVAFIDDLACVVKDEMEVKILLNKAQLELEKLGLVLNWDKSVVQPFGNKSKFKTYVNTSCDKEGGWVNTVYRVLDFRWMHCPPMHSQHWVEVKMVDFF